MRRIRQEHLKTDDITFVCNGKLAVPAVKYFLENIGEEKDYSACGGIAFFNSHFPFSDAYQVAEACCENAKKRAKEEENRGAESRIGNFMDFQVCTNVRAANLDASDVLRDHEGNPFVAGSSLAGAMRAYIEKKKTESCLMGFSKPAGRQNISDSGKMSSLFISDLNFDKGVTYGVRDNVALSEDYFQRMVQSGLMEKKDLKILILQKQKKIWE